MNPYRKPTQVIRSSRPRRTSDWSLKELGKKAAVTSLESKWELGKACSSKKAVNNFFEIAKVVGAAAKVSLATVYQKHSSLRTRKRMYRG
jgi:hypothetical protein